MIAKRLFWGKITIENWAGIFDIRISCSHEDTFKVFTKKYQTTSQLLTVLGKSFEIFPPKIDLYIEENLKSNYSRSF